MTTPNIDTKALRELEAKAREAGQHVMIGAGPMADWLTEILAAAPALLDEIESLREKVERYKSAARNPGDGERHRGTSVAIQLVHAQMKREETEAERDALRAEVAKAYANSAYHADMAQKLSAKLSASEREAERLRAALTPSGATKFAYMNEFKFNVVREGPDHSEIVERHAVPWTTIKDIMAAIAKRAALRGEEGN